MMHAETRLPDRWHALMRAGDFAGALALSDAMRATPPPDARRTPRHQQRVWTGDPIDGKVVLVRCYHGLGDTIMFARFLPALVARAAHVIVWAPPSLIPLLSTIVLPAPVDWLPLHDGVPGVRFDVDIEIMELTQLFRTTLDTLPAPVPYLHAPPFARERDHACHVGLVWSASAWAPERSMHVSRVVPLLDLPDIVWHSLQHGPGILGLGDELPVMREGTLLTTARRMRSLDLVISVDSMPAHLAGALGRPVWTLLPAPADWRWMERRADSPWYPTMRLFRQSRPGDWGPVIDEVAAALLSLPSTRAHGSAQP